MKDPWKDAIDSIAFGVGLGLAFGIIMIATAICHWITHGL